MSSVSPCQSVRSPNPRAASRNETAGVIVAPPRRRRRVPHGTCSTKLRPAGSVSPKPTTGSARTPGRRHHLVRDGVLGLVVHRQQRHPPRPHEPQLRLQQRRRHVPAVLDRRAESAGRAIHQPARGREVQRHRLGDRDASPRRRVADARLLRLQVVQLPVERRASRLVVRAMARIHPDQGGVHRVGDPTDRGEVEPDVLVEVLRARGAPGQPDGIERGRTMRRRHQPGHEVVVPAAVLHHDPGARARPADRARSPGTRAGRGRGRR